jgi:hypothetical protein
MQRSCHKDYVMEHAQRNLLTYETACGLGLIHIVHAVNRGDSWCTSMTEEIIRDCEHVFHGLGKLTNFQLTLNIRDSQYTRSTDVCHSQ